MKKVSHQRTTRMHKGIAFALFTLAFSLVHAEQLVINYNDNGTVTQRCAFTLDATAPVVIDSTTGDITAQVTDPDACGTTNPVPPTVTVTPATATVNLGNSQSISWTSSNADSCSKSGAWSGAAATSGNETVTPNATGTYTYTITCTNNDGNASDSSVVTVTDANVPAFCSTIPTFGLSRQASPATYAEATGHSWPGVVADSDFWSINSMQFVALQFVADTSNGTLVFEAGRPQEGPAAAYTVKISECPGDVTHNLPFDADTFFCQKSGTSVNLKWSNISEAGHCKLNPGTTYYLNVVHGEVDSTNSSYTNFCGSSFCSAAMQRTN